MGNFTERNEMMDFDNNPSLTFPLPSNFSIMHDENEMSLIDYFPSLLLFVYFKWINISSSSFGHWNRRHYINIKWSSQHWRTVRLVGRRKWKKALRVEIIWLLKREISFRSGLFRLLSNITFSSISLDT